MKDRYEGGTNKINKTSTAVIVHDNLRGVLLTVMVQMRARKMREGKRKQEQMLVLCEVWGERVWVWLSNPQLPGAPNQHNTFTGI